MKTLITLVTLIIASVSCEVVPMYYESPRIEFPVWYRSSCHPYDHFGHTQCDHYRSHIR